MPNLEPVVLDGHTYLLRHVGPRDQVWLQSPATEITVLNRTDMVARPLPAAPDPASPDFQTGDYDLRLSDMGDFTITFPNKEASDGLPWRTRFDPGGDGQRLQWVELWLDEFLEFTGVLLTVVPDRQQVQITGDDGTFCLKNAYERDWTVTQAPRDVFQRGTQVWVPAVADNFAGPSLSAIWTTTGDVSIGASGGCICSVPATPDTSAGISATLGPLGTIWAAEAMIQNTSALGVGDVVAVTVYGPDATYELALYAGVATFGVFYPLGEVVTLALTTAPSYDWSRVRQPNAARLREAALRNARRPRRPPVLAFLQPLDLTRPSGDRATRYRVTVNCCGSPPKFHDDPGNLGLAGASRRHLQRPETALGPAFGLARVGGAVEIGRGTRQQCAGIEVGVARQRAAGQERTNSSGSPQAHRAHQCGRDSQLQPGPLTASRHRRPATVLRSPSAPGGAAA